MDYVSPSIQAAYNSGLGVLCELAMIYDKAFYVQKQYLYCKQMNPNMN